ncbi:outer membrane beta-barrel protein [Parafilimonas sp.]|uniref:outer membrane beta-barrel protein n=1 Tax=Parafilimonas sp. TaxID=1969739 RepID=UPI0039E57273
MQKFILSLCFITALSAAASAQSFSLGGKVGANLGKIDGQSFKDGYNFGYVLGAYAEIGISKTIAIQPELLFSQTNTTYKDSSDAIITKPDKVHLNYLNVPILLNINASRLLTFQLGPQFSVLMNKDQKLGDNVSDAFKGGDLAAVLGAQLNFGVLKVYGRYNIGLSNISDVTDSDKWKSQALQFGLGIKIL